MALPMKDDSGAFAIEMTFLVPMIVFSFMLLFWAGSWLTAQWALITAVDRVATDRVHTDRTVDQESISGGWLTEFGRCGAGVGSAGNFEFDTEARTFDPAAATWTDGHLTVEAACTHTQHPTGSVFSAFEPSNLEPYSTDEPWHPHVGCNSPGAPWRPSDIGQLPDPNRCQTSTTSTTTP